MKDLISVIIPCYNAAKTLARTMNSVLEQDYKNIEIIIINDGSKDNTIEVANKFANLDKRVRVIDKVNEGVSVARNTGLKQAKGDYIMFLDADDYYMTPYVYTNMLNKIKESGADMCVCNFIHPAFEEHLASGVYDMTDHKQFMAYYQDFFSFAMPWNKMIKRECLTEDFAVGVKFAEDSLYNLDNLHNIKKIVLTSEVYHYYYCAPYNPRLPASAINSIYSADKFWENKCTIWYKGLANQNHRLKSILKYHPDKFADMQYVRVFDFFFWDFFMMARNRVAEDKINHAIESIFSEQIFIDCLKDKERYGLKVKTITEDDIKSFVRLAYYAFIEIKSKGLKISMYKVFLSLFGKYFYEPILSVDTIDILAEACLNLKNQSTPEALFVHDLLEEYENKRQSVFMFDNSLLAWLNAEMC